MINRRGFLGSLLAGAAGGGMTRAAGRWAEEPACADHPPGGAELRQYLKDLAACDLRLLGVPRRQPVFEHAFHPVAPERVIVFDQEARRRAGRQHASLKRWLRREEASRRRLGDKPLPPAKVDAMVGLMDRLSAYYRRPEMFVPWARTLMRRETLGMTALAHGVGLLHDFQTPRGPVRTASGVVDWWLALFPDGVDWGAFDDRPTYVMIGPIMEPPALRPYFLTVEAMCRAVRPIFRPRGPTPPDWTRLVANMGPADAARAINFLAVRQLQSEGRDGHVRSRVAPRSNA